MDKSQLRALVKSCVTNLSQKERVTEDDAVISRILSSDEWQKAKSIFCYISYGQEINTFPLLADALAKGKLLASPFITGEGIMEARQITNLKDLHLDRYGIMAPHYKSKKIDPEDIELVIIPGLAFERGTLLRLGRGGGYYDRYLAECQAFRLAPARACQVLEEGMIPHESHDLKMDTLITAQEMIKTVSINK